MELLNYEDAKRKGKVEKVKHSTRYGKFFFWIGSKEDAKTLKENLTQDYFDGPWYRLFPVEIRNKLAKLRWLDLGSKTGWFGFKLVHKLMPKVVYCVEPSVTKFGFLRHTHMNNDRNGCIAITFKHVVQQCPQQEITCTDPKGNEETHQTDITKGTVQINTKTGYAEVGGDQEQEVPLISFEKLTQRRNLNALRVDYGGYEKDILLKGDLSKYQIVVAKIDKHHYTDKESKQLEKKLNKVFDHFKIIPTDKKKVSFYVGYRSELVQE